VPPLLHMAQSLTHVRALAMSHPHTNETPCCPAPAGWQPGEAQYYWLVICTIPLYDHTTIVLAPVSTTHSMGMPLICAATLQVEAL